MRLRACALVSATVLAVCAAAALRAAVGVHRAAPALAAVTDGAEETDEAAAAAAAFVAAATEDELEAEAPDAAPAPAETNPKETEPRETERCAFAKASHVALTVRRKAWATRARPGRHYVHMPTVAVVKGLVVVAWQQAAHAEGAGDQALFYAVSTDGARSFGDPRKVPGGGDTPARWGPVLYAAKDTAAADLFFSQSSTCSHCRRPPCSKPSQQSWRAGGDVLHMRLEDPVRGRWSRSRVVLSERQDGPIPKLVANPPVAVGAGGRRLVLPYWRQHPRGPARCRAKRRADYAGVLLSDDGGRTWRARGRVRHAGVDWAQDRLLEGAVAEAAPGGRLLQLFRSTRNVTYGAHSDDAGETWSAPFAVPSLPNPNSKLHVLALGGSDGVMLAAYNHHRYVPRRRDQLYVAAGTASDPQSWRVVARLHHSERALRRLPEFSMAHYPQLLQRGPCELLAVWAEHGRGVRVASLSLSRAGATS